jgi:rod shape-determining protein MreD
MKRDIYYIFLLYIALAAQAVFFTGIKPDFVLILVCYYSLKYGRTKGICYGAFAGLLIDTVNGVILGPHMLSKSLAGFFIKTVRENLFQWNIYINTVALVVFSFINIVIVYVCLDFFSKISLANRAIGISAVEILYTVAGSLVLYPFFKPEVEVTEHIL